MSKPTEQKSENQSLESDLIRKIDRCQKVISGVRDNEVIQILFEDLGETRKRIDENWHLVTEQSKLQELRVTKLAVHTLINLVENYEHDLSKAKEQLQLLRNSRHYVNKDYDNEGTEE